MIVIAHSDDGFAKAELALDQHDAGVLRLRPWASVGGRFHDGGKPVAQARVFLNPILIGGPGTILFDSGKQILTGPNGEFQFDRVPPVPTAISIYLGPWKDDGFRSGPSVPVDLQPGQKVELDLGGAGATIAGKVKLTGEVPADLDCTYSLSFLIRRQPGIAPPPAIAKLGFDIRNGWRGNWRRSSEGHAYLSTLKHWFVKLSPDGSFRISGVPAGDYDLTIEVYAKPSGCLTDPLASTIIPLTVTADDVARGTMTVPEIAAKVIPIPGVGDEPSLNFQRADGSAGTLADVRGQHALVHFWASWCAPCKEQLPAVRSIRERIPVKELALLGLSLDEDAEAWQSALTPLNLPWTQGRFTGGGAGISSVPHYWLLDPAGKIVAKGFDVNEVLRQFAPGR